MVKKTFVNIVLLLSILFASFAIPTVVSAHHVDKDETAVCNDEGNIDYSVKGKYVGGSGTRRVEWNVDITVDDNTTNHSGSWQGVHNGTFTLFSQSGSASNEVSVSGTIEMFVWNGSKWKMTDKVTFGLQKLDDCEPPYVACSNTITVYGEWSEWTYDPNTGKEYRTRTVTKVDSQNNNIICSESEETEWRDKPYEACSQFDIVYGEWSEWTYDPNTGKEYRTRTVTKVDSQNPSVICGTEEETEWRDQPYEVCSSTTSVYGEWSEWTYDPNTGKEYRTRTVTKVDSNDNSVICNEGNEIESRETTPCIYDPLVPSTSLLCVEPETPSIFTPDVCPTCGASKQEILPDWGLNDITHNNGDGCFDYARAKEEVIKNGVAPGQAEKLGRLVTLKWGYKCAEMHTITSRLYFVVIDTNGTVYEPFLFTDWDGADYYFLSVQVDMKWWTDEDRYNATQRKDEFGNMIPIVQPKFLIRGLDEEGNYINVMDAAKLEKPNESFQKLNDIVCSLYPNEGFERMIDGQKFIYKSLGMTGSDFILKFRDMGWTDEQIQEWLQTYYSTEVGNLIPVD